jgi:hypothetical protein
VGRLIVFGLIVLVLVIYGGSWLVDDVTASSVRLQATIAPRILPADGQSTGLFTVRVTNPDGTPRVGDTVEVLDESSAGVFDRTRALTDQHGDATYHFTTSKSNVYQPAGPVPVLVTDTSLGHLVEVDKNLTVTISTVDPATQKKR